MKSKDEKWALFWRNLLHPLIFGEIEKEQTNHFLKSLCLQEVIFPNGKRKRPTISTIRRKLNRWLKARPHGNGEWVSVSCPKGAGRPWRIQKVFT